MIVACPVSGGELSQSLMCTLLVTQIVAYLVSVSKLAWLLMCALLVTLWPFLFQDVSWPGF